MTPHWPSSAANCNGSRCLVARRLFEQGDTSDAFYVLKSGSLGAFRDDANGQPRLVGVVAAGETVGEVGMIVDMPRNASVRALRDSELLRLSREAFENLVNHHPKSMLAMARLAVRRLSAGDEEGAGSSPRTFAVLRHDAGVDVHGFADELVSACSVHSANAR